jgi:hypothetical protein
VVIVTLVTSMSAFGQLSREHLSISDSLWRHIEQKAGFAKPFGFTEDEMRGYGPDEFVLRNVWTLFRNARTIPRYSGTVTKNLLDNIHDPAALIRTAYGCADISAGAYVVHASANNRGVILRLRTVPRLPKHFG